jgi:RNA polymerase II subunit A-like phosphatase
MNNRPTILHLPGHLPYPITISSLLVNPDSPIRKHDGLLVYKFFAYETEVQDDDQTEKPVRKEMVEQFDSPWEGILTEWLVKEGTIVNSSKFAPSLFIFIWC